MFPFIVADIGGTNARFCLVTGHRQQQFDFAQAKTLSGKDFSSFSSALRAYIDGLDGPPPRAACVAIAGPIGGDQVSMTNLDWRFSQNEIRAQFGFNCFCVINDFAAQAIACSLLDAASLLNVKAGESNSRSNKVVLGPGTGLGVAGLIYNADDAQGGPGSWLPVASEGGHVNLAPVTDLEADVIKAGIAEFGHVSAEVFISGPGLLNVYHMLAKVKGQAPEALRPRDITAKAAAGGNELCEQTCQLFFSFLGNVAGNLALTYGAKGGVYIGGGILPKISELLTASRFVQRFESKGIMSRYVSDIPVNVIVHKQPAFVGAAAWLVQFSSS